MAKLIFMVCFFFGAVSLALAQQGFRAQGFKVSVLNDADEPLIGAYIYVNDKPTAATDTLGLAVIPQDKLKLGDSITVSYVATKGESVAVDRIMLIKGEYEFVLDETHGTLYADAVTVKAKIKRLYRKSLPIRRLPPYGLYGLYSTHFTMNITKPGDSLPSHWVAGRVEGVFTSLYFLEKHLPSQYNNSISGHYLNPDPDVLDSLQRFKSSVGFVHDLPLEITTNDDTIGLEQTLKYFLPRTLQTNHLALLRVYRPEPNYKELEMYPNAKVNYGYLGKDEDTTNFRLTYSGHRAGTTSEVEVKSNVADRINRELLETTLSFKDTINGNRYYVKAKTRDEIIHEHICQYWPFWSKAHVPVELEYRIKESDGTVVNITMSNINIRSIFEKLKVRFSEIYIQDPNRFINKRTKKWKMHNFRTFYYDEIDNYLRVIVGREQKLKEIGTEAKQPKKGRKTRKPTSIFDN